MRACLAASIAHAIWMGESPGKIRLTEAQACGVYQFALAKQLAVLYGEAADVMICRLSIQIEHELRLTENWKRVCLLAASLEGLHGSPT
jgi:hypothetical protein